MRIIIAGGGTGGHIFPALAIAEGIKSRSAKNEILFVGTKNGLENEIIPAMGFNMQFINSAGFVGKDMVNKIKAIITALEGILLSLKIIRTFEPDVVLGVGGYASGPTVLCARLKSIPTAICEQNTVPGMTNRILSRFSNKIFLTFPDSAKYFTSEKTIVTGNPLRSNFKRQNSYETGKDRRKVIFVMGGSQGAGSLNRITPPALSKVDITKLEIFHQTGKKDEESVKKAYKELSLDSNVFSFRSDIMEIYKKSDLIISRSGAGTISEITAMGKASILIPFPHAAHNHQLLNAKSMENAGASIIIEEDSLDEINLSDQINYIFKSGKLQSMSEASLKLAKPEATNIIVEELYSLAGERNVRKD